MDPHRRLWSCRSMTLLGVWAHPDDEAYLSSGLMMRTVAAGGRVTVCAATAGERGFAAADPRSLDERISLRTAELRAAAAAAGVDDVRMLGWTDGTLGDVPFEALVAQISALIDDVRPDLVITFGPDGVTGHRDHVAIGRATTAAWTRSARGELLFAAQRQSWLDEWRELHRSLGVMMTEDDSPGMAEGDIALAVELDGLELDRKRAVLAAHASQTDGLVATMGESTYRRWIRAETFRRPTAAEVAEAAGTGPTVVER